MARELGGVAGAGRGVEAELSKYPCVAVAQPLNKTGIIKMNTHLIITDDRYKMIFTHHARYHSTDNAAPSYKMSESQARPFRSMSNAKNHPAKNG
jgi:hypothetical protein